jgi:hypothetical protein
LLIHTSTPCRISSAAMSAWMSEKPTTKSGCSFRISPIFAEVKALTFGFSRRAIAGAHREAADADDAMLLAQRVQHLGGLLGEADDALRAPCSFHQAFAQMHGVIGVPESAHGYSIRFAHSPARLRS